MVRIHLAAPQFKAALAQLAEAPDLGSGCSGFESLARHQHGTALAAKEGNYYDEAIMLTLKAMGHENLPDSDTRKSYTLYSGLQNVQFFRHGGDARHYGSFEVRDGDPMADLQYPSGDSREVPLAGNAYVMNESGKTVASFAHLSP